MKCISSVISTSRISMASIGLLLFSSSSAISFIYPSWRPGVSGSTSLFAISITSSVHLFSKKKKKLEELDRGNKCVMHRNAMRRRVWDSSKARQWAHFARWTGCLLPYPLKPSFAFEPGTCVQFDFRSGPEFNPEQWCWTQRKD